MKVNGNLWTLGPCLVGDGTSAQPTWGVNSLWSNLKNENNYILYLMNLIHGNIYTSIIQITIIIILVLSSIWLLKFQRNTECDAGSSVTQVLVPALRQHSVGRCKKPRPRRDCNNVGARRILAAQMCQWEQFSWCSLFSHGCQSRPCATGGLKLQ